MRLRRCFFVGGTKGQRVGSGSDLIDQNEMQRARLGLFISALLSMDG